MIQPSVTPEEYEFMQPPPLILNENEPTGEPETIHDEDGPSTWPPWPWPPWGPDEPSTPGERAHIHAKKVVEFERSLAQATLDL